GLCLMVSVPRPPACRAGASRRHTEARHPPGVRVWSRESLSPARVGTVGGQYLDVCCCDVRGSAHGLVGSVLPSTVWTLASGAAPCRFGCDPRPRRLSTEQGVRDSASGHRGTGALAAEGREPTPGHRSSAAKSRLSERKLKFKR